MNLIKIKNTQEQVIEVNLDCLAAIEEQDTTQTVLCFGGYYVTVDQDEYNRIKEILNGNNFNVLCEVSKTDASIEKQIEELTNINEKLDRIIKLLVLLQ